jgi:crotonobetainyl-CoA:carnitine CoA-transferase CaiB-like acyl-CoA transferase
LSSAEHGDDNSTGGNGVLAGLRVVELSHLIAGPYCAMLLADEGAEVVKVEPPQGELTRAREPIRTSESGSMSGYFGALNRRKSSIAIDLKSEAGIGLLPGPTSSSATCARRRSTGWASTRRRCAVATRR